MAIQCTHPVHGCMLPESQMPRSAPCCSSNDVVLTHELEQKHPGPVPHFLLSGGWGGVYIRVHQAVHQWPQKLPGLLPFAVQCFWF